MPPQLPPESHYDPKKLGMIFAIVTIILLLSLIGIFVKDYAREWKGYQRDFRTQEVEKARVKKDAELKELAKNEEYQGVLKDLETAKKNQKAKESSIQAVNRQIFAAEAVSKRHTQQIQFAKAEYDSLKYQYESAASHKSSNAPKLKERLDKLSAKIEDLRLKVENDNKLVKEKTAQLKDLEKDSKELEKKRMAATKKLEILDRKLKRIDIAEMSAANQFADMVRDLPIIELANPNYKIRQIVVKDIPEDVNFMKIQRVDRCTTCHLGIDNPDFKSAAQPFRSHPNLELFMDKNSPHPMQAFACTTCHGGRGRATDFISAAHTPQNEEQKKEWQKKYHWEPLAHWENPMLPATMTQAGCFKCHSGQEVVKGAEKLNLGIALIERAGCYNCHVIDKFKDWPKSGPTLEYIASKTTKEWAYHWIENPRAIRPDTWMPQYFHQSNNSDPASVKRSEQEINSIVHFLFANSKPFEAKPVAFTGDAVKGKELVASVGCMGCHKVERLTSRRKKIVTAIL
jgi:cytochrome c551/c552